MDNGIQEIWEAVKNDLEKNNSDLFYINLFINSITNVKINNNAFIIYSTEFHKEKIEKNYLSILNESLKKILGNNYYIEIHTDEDFFNINPSQITSKEESYIKNKIEKTKLEDNDDLDEEEKEFEKTDKNSFKKYEKYQLNPKFTFDQFVVGKNNETAFGAAKTVSEGYKKYNPLFLYSNVGLGKTHLMHAVGNNMLRIDPNTKIIYITSEAFVNEFVESIKNGKSQEFREKFRKVDLLMVDDVQFFSGKKETQEEFFNTFNELHTYGKQIILSSDRPPKDIKDTEERLISRFAMGFSIDLNAPGYETRLAILRKKLEYENREISDEVLSYIAKNIQSNVRELESALTSVFAHADIKNLKPDIKIAEEALKNYTKNKTKKIDFKTITDFICNFYAINEKELLSESKMRYLSLPRQISMYLCKEIISDATLMEIAKHFNKKDHTTISYAHTKIKKEMEKDEKFKIEIEKITENIKNN